MNDAEAREIMREINHGLLVGNIRLKTNTFMWNKLLRHVPHWWRVLTED